MSREGSEVGETGTSLADVGKETGAGDAEFEKRVGDLERGKMNKNNGLDTGLGMIE